MVINIAPIGTNITGMYRKCQALNGCENLVSCPYIMCNEHWIAKASARESLMKEILHHE
tara:strand:+ start:680 stop:856 length:177 start_codon:yes stop_codon:yes gene_type:complete